MNLSKVVEMKSIVIHFSQTGNTEKVAKAIQSGIESVTGQCDIVKLRDADLGSLAKYDLIGLGCPTFSFKEPRNVTLFIKRMAKAPVLGRHCFAFATHGGHPGNVLTSMASKLERVGLKVIGGFNCDGHLYLPFYTTPWFTDGHPDDIDLKLAADFGAKMVRNSEKLSKGEDVPIPKFKWLRGPLYGRIAAMAQQVYPELIFIREKCVYPKCRLCVEHCPAGGINLSVDPVVYRKGCIGCLVCEHICPTGAIEYAEGWMESLWKFATELQRTSRYVEWYQKAETELVDNRCTLYRRLGGEVEIGNPDRVYYKVTPKRPRVKHC